MIVAETKTVRVVIEGRVQGVWFRGWAVEQATARGLSGWIGNRADGSVERPATMTVFFNGVLVQDDVELLGATAHAARASYSKHDPIGPIRLQDHGDPIRFRNVWVRPLEPRRGPE